MVSITNFKGLVEKPRLIQSSKLRSHGQRKTQHGFDLRPVSSQIPVLQNSPCSKAYAYSHLSS